jgi:prolipoprotein diacylglyceryltransferase/protein-S-isoprenylcysteine O-methyltransferase Ste14
MMDTGRLPAGAVLYGLLFVVVVPAGLLAWAVAADGNVTVSGVRSIPLGLAGALVGVALMLAGAISLMAYGNGLPMNPYPPSRYVARGAYGIFRHPIYAGFSMLCAGVALLTGSASGLWLVTPVVVLSCAALVMGYETIDLKKRFGRALPAPYLRFPPADDSPVGFRDWLSVQVLVLIPWVILYELLAELGPPAGAVAAYLPFEYRLPVIGWTELLYASTYLLVIVAPAVAPSRRVLREFALQGFTAMMLMPLCFVSIPLIAPPREFAPASPLGQLLVFERGLDTAANAFPSYHVIWILLAMSVFAKRMPRARFAWWGLGIAVSLSCVATGMHALADVLAGAGVFLILGRLEAIWEFLRRSSERIANSWKEWSWGRVRIINHGLYGGLGSMLAVAIVGILLGGEKLPVVFFTALCALVVSALWAQVVEGSPSLLRPYGFYGGVLGIILGSLLVWPLFGSDPWLPLAAFSVAGPWVQSLGRLRCLVQGCCHGDRAPEGVGIVYTHPRSRVTRLSSLGGVPIHPTPLYSILWNVVIAVVLTRLWFGRAPLSMIAGLYLILTGIGRFAEEAYRGEPQTRVVAGLRFYQWIGVVTVVAGAAVTCIRSAPAAGVLQIGWPVVAVALLFGALTWFALGVDFPRSDRRFARLV